MNSTRTVLILTLAAALGISSACTKKVTLKPPAPPAPAADVAPPPAVARTERHAPAPATTTPAATERGRFPDAKTQQRIDELLSRIQDAYFDYDKHHLRADAEQTLAADAKELGNIIRQYPEYKLGVEGYADERGSSEYNLALGDARARTAKEYLVALGLPADQLNVVSYGAEKQVCTEHDEACWQKNRRVHISAMNRQ